MASRILSATSGASAEAFSAEAAGAGAVGAGKAVPTNSKMDESELNQQKCVFMV